MTTPPSFVWQSELKKLLGNDFETVDDGVICIKPAADVDKVLEKLHEHYQGRFGFESWGLEEHGEFIEINSFSVE